MVAAAEYGLENQKRRQRHPLRKHLVIIPQNQRVKASDQRSRSAEHQAKAHEPEKRRADGEIHQVLHDNVPCVFGSGKTGLHHCESSLHEKHQRRPYQNPDCVDCRKTHNCLLLFLLVLCAVPRRHCPRFTFFNNKGCALFSAAASNKTHPIVPKHTGNAEGAPAASTGAPSSFLQSFLILSIL